MSTYSSGTRNRSVSDFSEITKLKPACDSLNLSYLLC